ncbi:MAG: nucleotidyltransferase domain-containing protein [Ignavibacteriales bacterium]|nr:nucleotidyltransferase domain-containing protein [Ignavibacteriales bacterium]
MDQKEAIRIAREFLSFLIQQGYKIREAFLFGSFAANKFNDDRDIDIAIVIEELTNGYDELINLMKLRRKINLKIEPHPFDYNDFNESNPFTCEILRTGIKLV